MTLSGETLMKGGITGLFKQKVCRRRDKQDRQIQESISEWQITKKWIKNGEGEMM